MTTRRTFLRSLAVASAALYLRLKPESVAEVARVKVEPQTWVSAFTLYLQHDGKNQWYEVSEIGDLKSFRPLAS